MRIVYHVALFSLWGLISVPAGPPTPLAKQIVSWPLTGSLDTKTGPLAQEPGTFLALDNVRQERLNEWRNRQGITHSDTLDDIPGTLGNAPPLRFIELPGGGGWGLNARSTNVTSGMLYSPGVPSTGARWSRPATAQITPGNWARRAVSDEDLTVVQVSQAVGNGFRLIAWKPGLSGSGSEREIQAVMISNTDGSAISAPVAIGATTGLNPKCVYEASSNRFLLFWIHGTNVNVAQWNGATGAIISASTTLKTNAVSGTPNFDAYYYSNNTVTVVYEWTGSFVRQLEVNPSTLALTVDVDLAVAGGPLCLFPDPDASGTRFIVACDGVAPALSVLRTTTLGVVSTNHAVGAISSSQAIGCAYQAGASWQIVFNNATDTYQRLYACKRYSGTTGATQVLTPDGVVASHTLDSNTWREPNTDAMRFIMGIHVGGPTGQPFGDFQHSYFEYALEYDNGTSIIGNQFTEPQARLLPLNAGPAMYGSRPHATRTSSGNFTLPLIRLAAPGIAAGLFANLYAVDQWNVTYLSGSTAGMNLGPGLTGEQAGYIPAGSLLQSVNGQSIVAHGASAIPFPPVASLLAGAGLTSGENYQWKVSVEMSDENGNVWRSPRSTASNVYTPSGGNLSARITVRLSSLEYASRYRTIKIWRTQGNGSVYQLVHQQTRLCDPTNCFFTWDDTVTDANLALSNFEPVGVPASVTPAFTHIANFDGRMWGSHRDFPDRLFFSQPAAAGISPEFPGEFMAQGLQDEFGEITAVAALDDKLIIGKDGAIYFIPMGGPNLDGSGQTYKATRITADQGFAFGTPYHSTGDIVYFFGHKGVYSIDRSLAVTFLGKPIDRYFNQPLVTTAETPIAFTSNHVRGEVRLLTTNYRFVFDAVHGSWIRDTGGPAGALGMYELSGTGDMFIRSNGQIWWDYTTEASTRSSDASGTFTGILRSPWIRLANVEGYIRLYASRGLFLRTPNTGAAAYPTTKIYRNNDDTLSETFTPLGTSNTTPQVVEARPAHQKCTSFSLEYQLPPSDIQWRIDQWCVLAAAKKSLFRRPPAQLARSVPSSTPPTGMDWWGIGDIVETTDPSFPTEVTRWTDNSGFDRDGLPLGSILFGDRPTVATAVQNGRNAIQFTQTGTTRFLESDTSVPLVMNATDPLTVYTVLKPTSATGGGILGYCCDSGTAPPNATMTLFLFGGVQYLYSNFGVITAPRATPVDYTGQAIILAHYSDGTNIRAKINNVEIPLSPSLLDQAAPPSIGFFIGGAFMAGGIIRVGCDAYFCEQILYHTNPVTFGSADDTRAHQYLSNEWAVAI